MATEVIIPALGLIVEIVKILRWMKSEGDRVEKDEPLLEIESDKVVTEITSPTSGILGCILYGENAQVPITTVVAVIVAEDEEVPESYRQQAVGAVPVRATVPTAPPSAYGKTTKPIKAVPAARKMAEEKGVDLSLVPPTGPHNTIMRKDVEVYLASAISEKGPQEITSLERKGAGKFSKVLATPTARKLAEREAIPLSEVKGTGRSGRVMKADVLEAKNAPKPSEVQLRLSEAKVSKYQLGQIIPMNSMRKVIAKRMTQSKFTAPHIYFFNDVDMEKLVSLREEVVADFERNEGVRISINDLMIKAVALNLREYPHRFFCRELSQQIS